MKKKMGLTIAVMLLLVFSLSASMFAASPDDIVTSYSAVDTPHGMRYRIERNGVVENNIVLNVYASTPASGNYVTTYPWSGNMNNSTQTFERYAFASSGGYQGQYYCPLGYPNIALNYRRTGGLNPRVTLGTVVGNYAGDIDIQFSQMRFQTPTALPQHNYEQYFLEDASIGTSASGTGKYLIWGRHSWSTFNPSTI